MNSLSPLQKKVLRARGGIAAFVPLAAAAIAETIIMRESALPLGIAIVIGLLAAFLLIVVIPPRRYRAWAYEMSEDELHVQHGIWLQSLTIVPFGRVQHIDVSQGPIERRYGVGTLTLHTAGTRSSAVTLPGLEMADAERMRDEIRGKIRQDLA